jgi:hypothetical protein
MEKKMRNKILMYLLVFFIGSFFSIYSEEKKEISVMIENGKSKDKSNPTLKFKIKNITNKSIDTKNMQLSSLGIISEEGGIGGGYMHMNFTSLDNEQTILPGKAFVKLIQLKPLFSFLPDWDKIKDSKKDFDVNCNVRYKGESYPCSKLRMKIN